MIWLINNDRVSHDEWLKEKDYQILLYGDFYFEKTIGVRNLMDMMILKK